VGTPVPDIVIWKVSASMPIVVLDDLAPALAGWNSQVNVHASLGASGAPAQFCERSKFVGSFGTPPAKFGVWVVELTFVIVTASEEEPPTDVSGNVSVVGVTVKSPGAARAGVAPWKATPGVKTISRRSAGSACGCAYSAPKV
jgi:hypothetical protein